MKLTGNTILVTGGGSGIGRGLAEELHKLGNKVIIAGRRSSQLDSVVKANPGMESVELDVADATGIQEVSRQLVQAYPSLNVLINNAGIMLFDNAAKALDENTTMSQIETNLLGSIRLTSALIEHLKTQPASWVIYNSSCLAFTPLAQFAIYSATKAFLHSYAMSQRFMLRKTSVKVQEIAPPWVGTDLLGNPSDSRAMPLDQFIAGTMKALGTESEEVLVDEARLFRNNVGPSEYKFLNEVNASLEATLTP
ncbi:SDR family NAD(P)-dependent oxidoreductase [Solimonas sp. K1W22B-7]|uniref:SDR family oxidoreductase n=1 Tax=Solimonas sp. K1W22B-7 TaxID=2303331 RepID=UPI000E336641|nr:SDR family NAD(P)-dependent oxidoreductase [Solimonas sp. K1W22B-7]AXQ29594.1 SDR family NAD(P)-dependent oxidoreductase [Solimonas sp. K1W22B-7]